MDANQLEFPDDSFDVVFGRAILHHLDVERSLAEIHRVLRPGGFMLFKEPLGINPVSKVVRRLTPFARTEDERPFDRAEFALLDSLFRTTYSFEQLFSTPLGVVSRAIYRQPRNVLTRTGFRIDRYLDERFPKLRPHYRKVLIYGQKV